MHFCARIHDHGQMLGLITCSEHRKFLTNHITSGLGKSRESRRSGRFRRSTWREDVSRSPPEPPRFPSLPCCSQGQTDQVVPFQTMTKPGSDVNTTCVEETSGDDFAQCGGFVIFPHFLHRSLSLSLVVSFLAFAALAARLRSRTFV